MREVIPKPILIGQTQLNRSAIQSYLTSIGADKFDIFQANPYSDGDALIEFMGRICYRSFQPNLNANVTKTRSDSKEYIGNILSSGHGSVLEHPVCHWIFQDVSRVFTHELVRHRAGCAFSQESLRYVRLTDLGFWIPPSTKDNTDVDFPALFQKVFSSLEELQFELAEKLKLDGLPFHQKKILTSAMRRFAPIGLATTIGFSCNLRALRHILQMRVHEAAEEEINYVFGEVALIAKREWPSAFQDMDILFVEDQVVEISWKHNKV